MSKQADYTKAVELAKAGKLEAAQSLLLTIDHPKATALLEKVNVAIAARGSSATVAQGIKQAEQEKLKAKGQQTLTALLVSIVLVVGCCSWLSYLGQPKPLENLEKMCDLVRSVGFKCDAQEIMRDYPNDVNYCQTTYGNFVGLEDLKHTWQNCLRSRGVEFQVDN